MKIEFTNNLVTIVVEPNVILNSKNQEYIKGKCKEFAESISDFVDLCYIVKNEENEFNVMDYSQAIVEEGDNCNRKKYL